MATITKPKITLYVDIVSPFAYMAYYILRVSPPPGLSPSTLVTSILTHHAPTQHDPIFATCDVKYIPIFLGGLMHKVRPPSSPPPPSLPSCQI